MSYFDISESRDTMIKITEEDQTESTNFVNALLSRIGVSLPLSTTPYEVRCLAIAIAHKHRALLLSGRGQGASESDAYLAKYKVYDIEARAWEAQVMAKLTNTVMPKSFSMTMRRG